jgi:hypothetical protein
VSDQITCVCGTEFEGNAAKLVRIRVEQFAKKMVAILVAVILAGCGGGGGASTPAPTPPPPVAQTQDDTSAVQAAVDAGGVVNLSGTYLLTQSIVVTKSGTVIQGGGTFTYKPGTKPTGCSNDAAFTTPCIDSMPRQQITANIAIGSNTLTAAGDLAALVPGVWLVISERDNLHGDIVAFDWAQVRSVASQTVTVSAPFRTAFSAAQPFDPNVSGLGFIVLPNPVSDIEYRNITINAPNAVAIQIDGSINVTVENVTTTAGDGLYSFQAKGLTVSNANVSATVMNEFAATVDLQLLDSTFASSGGAAIGLDLGTGFFTINEDTVTESVNVSTYFFVGVHDGVMENTTVAPASANPAGYAVLSLLGDGAYNCTVTNNSLPDPVIMQPDENEAVPVPATNDTVTGTSP